MHVHKHSPDICDKAHVVHCYILYLIITHVLTVHYIVLASEYSMQLNASRIKVLQAQDDFVNSMKEAAAKELLLVSNNHQSYEKLLKDLIVQVQIMSQYFFYVFPKVDVAESGSHN